MTFLQNPSGEKNGHFESTGECSLQTTNEKASITQFYYYQT